MFNIEFVVCSYHEVHDISIGDYTNELFEVTSHGRTYTVYTSMHPDVVKDNTSVASSQRYQIGTVHSDVGARPIYTDPERFRVGKVVGDPDS